jgi:NAD(P)-dependent dehydrogenase (short-subunit alcohol dehydrogenase family)
MSVTVITGAGGGMGRHCVERFRGDRLLLVDVDERALEGAGELAPGAECVLADLGSRASIDALVRQVEASGGLHRLVHLAGVSPMMDGAARILEVDLVGTAVLLDGMVGAAGEGSVAICVASIAAHVMPVSPEAQAVLDDPMAPDLAARLERALGAELGPGTAYALAKHGVVRLCQRSAAAWGARGARVLSVSPGLIDTPMGRLELKDNPGKRGLIGRTPIHAPDDRGSAELPGRTADIADAVAFLAGPRARFISGCDVRVDGGLVAALTAN